jgi:hypothetical protein
MNLLEESVGGEREESEKGSWKGREGRVKGFGYGGRYID